jgi:cell division initiation protein
MTPLDIKKHVFARKWQGHDPTQVQAFLDLVAKEFEELIRKNSQLQERLKASEERVYHYCLIEKTLQDTAVTLQKTLDEKRKTAEQEADVILQQARTRADEESQASREQLTSLRAQVQALDSQKQEFFVRLRNLLQDQSQALETLMQREGVSAPPTP